MIPQVRAARHSPLSATSRQLATTRPPVGCRLTPLSQTRHTRGGGRADTTARTRRSSQSTPQSARARPAMAANQPEAVPATSILPTKHSDHHNRGNRLHLLGTHVERCYSFPPNCSRTPICQDCSRNLVCKTQKRQKIGTACGQDRYCEHSVLSKGTTPQRAEGVLLHHLHALSPASWHWPSLKQTIVLT